MKRGKVSQTQTYLISRYICREWRPSDWLSFPSEFEFMCLFVRLPLSIYLSLSASSLVTYPGGAWGIKLLWIKTHPAIHASAKHQHKIVNEYRSCCCDLPKMVKLLLHARLKHNLDVLIYAKSAITLGQDLHARIMRMQWPSWSKEINNAYAPPLNIYISSHPSLCLPLPDGTDSLTCLITPILAPLSLSFCCVGQHFSICASWRPATCAEEKQRYSITTPNIGLKTPEWNIRPAET